jgi:hypothetical protein
VPLHEYSPRGSPDWENRAEPVSRQELARVDRLARKLDNVSAVGMEVHVTDAGLHFGPAEPQSFDARITGQVTSSIPFYNFAELVYNGVVDDWVAREGGIAGTSTNGVQAVESTGNAAVPADPTTGARVRLHRLAPGRYGFTLPAGGALVVQDTNGVTNVSPCSTLVFDNANGLFASDQGGGTAEVQVNLKRREVHPTGSYSIPDTTFADVTAFSLTLYEAGTYLLYANYYLNAKLDPTATQGRVFVRLVAGPSGSLVALAGSVVQASQPAVIAGGVAQDWQQTMNLSPILYTAANNNEVVQVQAYKADGPWTSCTMHADGGTVTSSCRLGALKVGV